MNLTVSRKDALKVAMDSILKDAKLLQVDARRFLKDPETHKDTAVEKRADSYKYLIAVWKKLENLSRQKEMF